MKRGDYIGIGLITVFGLGIIYWIASNFINLNRQEEDLIRREISGIIVSIKDTDHGYSKLGIQQDNVKELLMYDLDISSFFREHHITVNDSISKEAGSHTVNFYKRKNDRFEKCCEWKQ